ncbi:MAG: hypothetical protein JWP57_4232, partial [Spirosoma sp.]|nr:hypothetical protein [Spirosoma sp.]
MWSGPGAQHADIPDTESLRRRAVQEGMPADRVQPVDHVLHDGSLDVIERRFDAVLSSHVIEHQPDLVRHPQEVERRLEADARYLVLVPDKRYCFDRDMPASAIGEVLQAHVDQRRQHTLRSVVEHHASKTHNDAHKHWLEPRRTLADTLPVDVANVIAATREHREAGGRYIDVHAWYFTPDSFRQILGLLHALDLTRLRVERLYRTRQGSPEFWAVLARSPSDGGPWAGMSAQPEIAWGGP